MAYDFACMGIDIRDVFRTSESLTPRYVLMLVGQLPDSAAYVAAARGGPQFRPWTSTTHLLATLVNLTHAANRQRGGKPTRKPLIAPPETKRKARKMTVSELKKLASLN